MKISVVVTTVLLYEGEETQNITKTFIFEAVALLSTVLNGYVENIFQLMFTSIIKKVLAVGKTCKNVYSWEHGPMSRKLS